MEDRDTPQREHLSSQNIRPSVHIHPSILLTLCGKTQVEAPCALVGPYPIKPSRMEDYVNQFSGERKRNSVLATVGKRREHTFLALIKGRSSWYMFC